MPKAKIICTLGPSTDDPSVLLSMMRAGMDVARLNFSHASLQEHLGRVRLVRRLNKQHGMRVQVLGDLEGHRIRIGALKGGRPFPARAGDTLWLVPGNGPLPGKHIPFDYAGPLKEIKKGARIYIDDGNICLEVIASSKSALKAKVAVPGLVKERKGVNIPGVRLQFTGLSPKDISGILFCAENGVEIIAQSFVRNREDIEAVRREVRETHRSSKIVAKIENWEGIRNIGSILEASDGIMIARGDMGISIPIYEVPMVQKRIIRECNKRGKFVITATQMLESMTENRIPTRAEVSDVANAILDGTDYVMLSGETAVGKYPAETVALMDKIIAFTEASSAPRSKSHV